MKRRNYGFVFVLSAVSILYACNDDSYVGAGEDLYSVTEPIPVMVSVGDPTGNIMESKGSGSIDGIDDFQDKSIYVYAFRKDADVSYSITSAVDPESCLVDGSKDSHISQYGKKANLKSVNSYADWAEKNNPIYWPSAEKYKMAYDFFAYYIDDAVPNSMYREQDRVSFKLKIDGKTDVMSSKAELTDEQKGGFSDRDRRDIESLSFSYYTAQRNVSPIFRFEHHLSKLRFELVPGLTQGIEKRITVSDIKVLSHKEATFTVAAKNSNEMGLVFHDDLGIEQLPNKNSQYLYALGLNPLNAGDSFDDQDTDEMVEFVTRKSESTPIKRYLVDENLLVAPSKAGYRAFIKFKEDQLDNNGNVVKEGVYQSMAFEIPFVSDNEPFLSGNQYKVTITVFGVQNISVSVSLTPWNKIDIGIIDTEDKWDSVAK